MNQNESTDDSSSCSTIQTSPEPALPAQTTVTSIQGTSSSILDPPISYTSCASTKNNLLSTPHTCSSINNSVSPAAEQSLTSKANQNANECSICLDNVCDCAFCTCGHMCACYDCAVDILMKGDRLCPICRQEVKDVMKIYKS